MMTDNRRTIESLDEVTELDWEVPGASYEVPVLDYSATTDEVRANLEHKEQQVQSCLLAFENYNKVTLEGDAYEYFISAAEVFYSD
jgi:hypothetical protein